MSDLYREEILEHYKNPQNYGELENADQVLEVDNPLCGDRQTWYVKLTSNTRAELGTGQAEKNKTIDEISFTGDGCAISTAAASLLSEYLKGKSVVELKYITEEKMSEFIGARVAPGRVKCLMLPVSALRKLTSNP